MLRFASTRVALLLLASTLMAGCTGEISSSPSVANVPRQLSSTPPARTEFDAVFDRWTQLLGELREVDRTYRNVEPEAQDGLRQRYTRLVEKGNELQDSLIRGAVVTYATDPTHNQELAMFLRGVVHLLASHEDYEESLRVGQLLIDNFFEDGSVYNVCGICAFTVGEFSLAEKHLKQAEKAHALSQIGSGLLKNIAYYKDAWANEQELRAAERAAGDLPRVLLTTTQGEIELELFTHEAPNTAANFLQLVEEGFYDGLEFYRVMPQFMAVSGCPEGNGMGGPGYTTICECLRPDHRLHFRGSVGMIRSGTRTHGSQFYLLFTPARQLDGQQTVFGRIVRGIDVLARLQRREPRDPIGEAVNPHANVNIPVADRILRATVVRKRDRTYDPPIFPRSTSSSTVRRATSLH